MLAEQDTREIAARVRGDGQDDESDDGPGSVVHACEEDGEAAEQTDP